MPRCISRPPHSQAVTLFEAQQGAREGRSGRPGSADSVPAKHGGGRRETTMGDAPRTSGSPSPAQPSKNGRPTFHLAARHLALQHGDRERRHGGRQRARRRYPDVTRPFRDARSLRLAPPALTSSRRGFAS